MVPVLGLVLGMLPLGVRPWVGSGLSVVLGRDVVSNSGGRRMKECHLEEQVPANSSRTLHVKSSQALTGQDDSHQQPQQQEQQATEQQDTEAGEVAVWL